MEGKKLENLNSSKEEEFKEIVIKNLIENKIVLELHFNAVKKRREMKK